MNKLRVLVTGGAGFIGSHIVEHLLKSGANYVRILDNLSTGSMQNIETILKNYSNVELINGDIRNLDQCLEACHTMNAICHQAAFVSVPNSINNPLINHDINVNGFLNILTAAKNTNIKRIVYASSSAVYGTSDSDNNSNNIRTESDIPIPKSPYAASKFINEIYGKIYTEIYDLECIGLRYFNVFGPKQDPLAAYAAAIPKFINTIISGNNPIIYGDGSFCRDFVHVNDVVHANILALTTINQAAYGNFFNVGTGQMISINDLFYLIKQCLNKTECEVTYSEKRLGDIPYMCASTENIQLVLGYKPMISLQEGLIDTIEYLKH